MKPLKKDTYIEVTLSGNKNNRLKRKQAACFFEKEKIPASLLVLSHTRYRFGVHFYTTSMKQKRCLYQKFHRAHLRGLKWESKILAPKNWREKWKENYHIHTVGTRWTIIPWWERKAYHSSHKLPLYVEPGSAFGSGTHETTKLVLRMMERMPQPMGTFLDLGTGTGILSIAAFRLGSSKIHGIDYDSASIRAAKKNLKHNGASNAFFECEELAHFHPPRRFHFISANLVANVLLKYKQIIRKSLRKGGDLIVSGILKEDHEAFIKSFRDKAWKCRKVLKGRRWVAILYRKVL